VGSSDVKTAAAPTLLSLPLILYVLSRILLNAPGWPDSPIALGGLLLGVAVCVLPVRTLVSKRRGWWHFLPWAGLCAFLLSASMWSTVPWAPAVPALTVGVVLGSPVLLLAWVLVWRESLVAIAFNGTLALAVGAFDLAVVRDLRHGLARSVSVSDWWSSVRSVVLAQWSAAGGGDVDRSLAPLGYLQDPLFDAAALTLLMGLLLSFLLGSVRLVGIRPKATPTRTELPPGSDRTAGLPILARGRLPSSAYVTSGIASTVAALLAMVVFEWSAATYRSPTLAGLAVGTIGLLIVLIVVTSGPRRVARPLPNPKSGIVHPRPIVRGLNHPQDVRAPPLPYPSTASQG
jgi:hypothetical protein